MVAKRKDVTEEALLEEQAEAKGMVGDAPTSSPESAEDVDEAAVLRGELETAQTELADYKNRFLRARADLENYRRRAAQDSERARESGLDSAILPLLSVYDDLGRALGVSTDDPSQLIPGIQAVREGLLRNLASLGISEVGVKGEVFNPDLHEALTAVPTQDDSTSGTIAEVVQVGFVKEERLVRPAKVLVFQS